MVRGYEISHQIYLRGSVKNQVIIRKQTSDNYFNESRRCKMDQILKIYRIFQIVSFMKTIRKSLSNILKNVVQTVVRDFANFFYKIKDFIFYKCFLFTLDVFGRQFEQLLVYFLRKTITYWVTFGKFFLYIELKEKPRICGHELVFLDIRAGDKCTNTC